MLKNKKILIGISGGIAAYKIVDVVSRLRQSNAIVKVIMTEHSKNFIHPLTFQTISGNKVANDLFSEITSFYGKVEHISLSDWPDLFLIAPATANIIGKVANGIADDLLSTVIIATKVKTVFAPSMNVKMYENVIVQQNIAKLKELGYFFIRPDKGHLACGYEGLGRLPQPKVIVDYVKVLSNYSYDLTNTKILVTAGATREYWDEVRCITNDSSGKMGYAIAQSAAIRGAKVTLISGQTSLSNPKGVDVKQVISAKEMYDAVMQYNKDSDIIIMTAAVADYKFAEQIKGKMKKKNKISVKLVSTIDTLKKLGSIKRQGQILVGFAAEMEHLKKYAMIKMQEKNLDMIIANDISIAGQDNTSFTIFSKTVKNSFVNIPKFQAANLILDEIKNLNV
ncbi:MAG: bifunctional phosphopantothenoylcysteine decarboxylase/phosphopantothenate--cysteine ligase CoaBC [Candidatus Cloacimonadota bacterium]|nr:MAG: bifunctional phosphopantothenoylcysteine decarboxylase/phosphopantothenate--cysteine ligase CoaBC [Candidatus Cloacimonadota bacterium]